MQPNNEEIIKEIAEAEIYIRSLIGKLILLNAPGRMLSDVAQCLQTLSCSYGNDNHYGHYIGQINAPIPQELPPLFVEQITKAVKEAIK